MVCKFSRSKKKKKKLRYGHILIVTPNKSHQLFVTIYVRQHKMEIVAIFMDEILRYNITTKILV
ncbi:hypothetical protein HanIR_Chr05g0208901 [Helianthus annuus]|nr:hypothetical protein HanIR_Chr05g0208901 [Helianthus annuus]